MISVPLLSFLMALGGCSSAPPVANSNAEAVISTADIIDIPVVPFEIDSLYDLLVADVALTRNQFGIALPIYLTQARETGDTGVIEMAGRVASYMGDHQATLEMAQLWLANEPQNTAAREAMMQAYAKLSDPVQALDHASWLYENTGDSEAFFAVTAIPKDQAQIPELIEAYGRVKLSGDKQAAVLLATGILYRDNAQLQESEQQAKQFLAAQPDDQRGLLLLAQVMHQQNRIEEAQALIADALQRQPEDRKLRLQYARFLTITDRSQAVIQFEQLHSADPTDQEVNFLLALLLLNQGNISRATGLFTQASSVPSLRADAQYHLGAIADKTGQPAAAVQHYSQVRFGRNFLAAASRATLLLAQHKNIDVARRYLQRLRSAQPEQAVALFQIESNLLISARQPAQALSILTDGLNAFPNDSQLLYARSMVAEQQNNFPLAEQDLRALLAQNEDNAVALNALGYTMILHTDRREEAHALIKRAYLLNPGDPATIDSMGWVLFKMGQLEEALTFLKKAHGLLPDPEISAHLGEVQWAMGNSDRALQVWQQGLAQVPNHPSIVNAMERLGASLNPPAQKPAMENGAAKSSTTKGAKAMSAPLETAEE